MNQADRVLVQDHADPGAVEKHTGLAVFLFHGGLFQGHKGLQLLDECIDRDGAREDGDGGGGGHVLDDTDTVALWGLTRTHIKALTVVLLSWSNQLARLLNRSRDASQMRDGRRIVHAIEHL